MAKYISGADGYNAYPNLQEHERCCNEGCGFPRRKVGANKTSYIEAVFESSSNQEFYFYRQPVVKKIEPTSGLTDGGTVIDITGSWFDEKPEYGVFPFCRIGG